MPLAFKPIEFRHGTPQALVETFAEYVRYADKDINDLVMKQARELTQYLFLATPKASASEIAQKVRSLGWRVKRPGYDSRVSARKIHRAMGWLRNAQNDLSAGISLGKLKVMQDAVIAIRQGRIGAMRAGWIPGMQKLGSKMAAAASNKRRKNLGEAQIEMDGQGRIKVTIINNMPGIVELDRKAGIVDKAFHLTTINMQKYIERKKQERAYLFNRTGKI